MTDPFKDYTPTELLGYIWHRGKEEGLRHALELCQKECADTKETLDSALREFRRAGLVKAAEIIEEFRATAPKSKEVAHCYASNTRHRWDSLPESCKMLGSYGQCYCLINRPYMRS